MSQQNHKIS